jgi:hypothetical protein
MPELFRIGTDRRASKVAEEAFRDEVSDLEGFIKANPTILGEKVNIFAEQIDTGLGSRLDLLGVDQSLETGKLLLVELKNEPADVRVLLQVLRYAGWVSSSPDSVRLLLERRGIDASKVEITPRIVVLAPAIQDELVELSQYITTFEFTFIEVRRFKQGDEQFVVVERRTAVPRTSSMVTAQEEWAWERYERDLKLAPDKVALGRLLAETLSEMLSRRGVTLEMRFRKGYTPFQMQGGWNVIGTESRWASGWSIWFKLPASPEELQLPLPSWAKQTHWAPQWNTFYVNVTDQRADLEEVSDLLDASLRYVADRSGQPLPASTS